MRAMTLAQIDASSRLVPKPGILTVEIDGEAVLFDEEGDQLHHLNRTATIVWSCLDGEASLAEIVTDLSEVLDASYETVMADTISVCRDLAALGLFLGVDAESLTP